MASMMFDFRNTKLCAALLASFALAACSSSSDDSLLNAPEVNTPEVTVEPDQLEPIATFLSKDVAENIQLDDGLVPLTDGNWPRFTVNTTWNWQLSGELNAEPEADVYVVDMFAQLQEKSIEPLHALGLSLIHI